VSGGRGGAAASGWRVVGASGGGAMRWPASVRRGWWAEGPRWKHRAQPAWRLDKKVGH
jgi:hypothetical protein